MPTLPTANILVIASPSATGMDYGTVIDADHTIDIIHTVDELMEFPPISYDLVFIDDQNPKVDPRTIAHRLAPEAKLTLITDSKPVDAGIDTDFDDYLVRPLTAWDFERTIESLRARQIYVKRIDDLFEVASRMAEVEVASSDPRLDAEYRTLYNRAEELQAELKTLFDTLSEVDDPAKIFYDLEPAETRDPPTRPAAIVN